MTFNPPRLLEWRAYMQQQTGLPAVSLGIAGSAGHRAVGTSYHLGLDDLILSKNPYSYHTARDRAGASNAASATDTGNFPRLVELTMWAVAEARAGRRPDTREIIGPWSDGRAYRFDHLNGWRAELRPRGDSHETHMHESRYRDAEHRDWIQYYRPFFEEEDMPTVKEIWESDIIEKPPGYEDSKDPMWRPSSVIRSTQYWARRGALDLSEVKATVKATHAAVVGQDVAEQVAGALAEHRATLLGELAGPFTDRIAERLTDVPADQVRAALREELAALRLVVDEAEGDG